MPFFWHLIVLIINISEKYTMNKPSLRVDLPVTSNQINLTRRYKDIKKRVSSFISGKSVRASMTLEAALVLPIFLFALLSLISMFNIMKIKGCMDVAVAEAGNEIALENYGQYIGDLAMPLYVKSKIDSFLDKNLAEQDRETLSKSIFITDISFLEDENIVAFRVDYKVTSDFGVLGFASVKLHTICYGYSWLGYEAKEETERMVFISNNASVYHLDKNCTYLNVDIKQVSYASLEQYRNESGGKYGTCNFCNKISNNGIIYITSEGKNYHNIENCIGLTRSIYTVPMSTVSGKRCCTRCGE